MSPPRRVIQIASKYRKSAKTCLRTVPGWITTLTEVDVRMSMDGLGCYLDNIFIERFWLSL